MTDVILPRQAAGLRRIRKVLTRYGIGMGGLALFLLLANRFCDHHCGGAPAEWIATFSLLTLAILSGRAVFSLISHDPDTLWTPAVLFPASTLLFFGVGSLSTLFADEQTLRVFLAGNYGLNAASLMRPLLLTTAGVAICVAFMIFGSRLSVGKPHGGRQNAKISLPATAVFFVVAGFVLKYGLVLPAQWGLTNITVPGTLKGMTGILDLGLAVMTYMAARGRKIWLLIFLLIWPVHLGLCLLELSKRVMMFAILLPAVGAYLGHRNWKRLLPWLGFAVIVYATLQSINTEARLSIMDNTGYISKASFEERVGLLRKTFSADADVLQRQSVAKQEAQIWWLRLNYSGAQLRAMELYDSGRPGKWDLSIAAALIPRFIWPSKPIQTSQGQIFNQIVSGNVEASTRVGVTIYADGYWLMGWPGAILFSAIMGTILGVITRINYRLIGDRQLIYLPVIFLGMSMAALGPMGYLQKNIVAAMPIYFGYLFVINIATRLRVDVPKGNALSIESGNRYAP